MTTSNNSLPPIIKGTSWGYVLTLQGRDGNPFVYTDSTLTGLLLPNLSGAASVASFAIQPLTAGQCKISITPDQTRNLSVGNHFHQLTLVEPDGWTTRLVDNVPVSIQA